MLTYITALDISFQTLHHLAHISNQTFCCKLSKKLWSTQTCVPSTPTAKTRCFICNTS